MSASAQTMMREYAAFRWPTVNHKGRVAKLARQLGFNHRRVRAIYQNETGVSLRADEMAAIAALQKVEEANRNDFQALQARIARLEAALFQSDAEFHFEQVAALRASVDGRRGDDEPSAVGRTEGER